MLRLREPVFKPPRCPHSATARILEWSPRPLLTILRWRTTTLNLNYPEFEFVRLHHKSTCLERENIELQTMSSNANPSMFTQILIPTPILIYRISVVTSAETQSAETIANSPWNKEPLIAVLGVLVPVVLAVASLGVYLFRRWRLHRKPKVKGKYVSYEVLILGCCPALTRPDVEESGAIASNTSGIKTRGKRWRTRRRSSKTFLIFL
jgi:hypothetical protein